MARPWLTDGNIEYARVYQDALQSHFHGPAKEKNKWDESLPHLKSLRSVIAPYASLQGLGITKPIPPRATRKNQDGNPVDKSEFQEPKDGWLSLIAEDVAASFGRGGGGAIATMAEALLVINSLARPHGAGKVYYRGEHQYGYELKSRAQRKMEKDNGAPLKAANGITERELDELRRFQKHVKSDAAFVEEIVHRRRLPADDDPEWLPIMQHYDVEFGTRLLDITRSIFAGLHFACIDWDGTIDFDTDGLLYMFFGHGRYYLYQPTGGFDDEISEFVPDNVACAFKDWRHPEYMHHFSSSQSSMRELAQDGLFLVQGDLGSKPVFAGNGKFKFCVPRWAKARIIEELWLTGYTPEKIVRGEMGKRAAEVSREQLEEYRKENPECNLP